MEDYARVDNDSDELVDPINQYEMEEEEGLLESIDLNPNKLWKNYKNYIIYIILIVIFIICLYFGIKWYRNRSTFNYYTLAP